MEKLIETIVALLEIMVLGVLTVGVLGYLIALVNPVGRTLIVYLNTLSKVLVDKHFNNFAEWIKVGLVLMLIYYAGILTNGASYWILSPAHNKIISNVGAGEKDTLSSWELWLLPFARHSQNEIVEAYRTYINQEVSWQNKNLEAAKHALDPMHRDVRLFRGTVFLALCLVLIALLKLVFFSISMILDSLVILWTNNWGHGRLAALFYRWIIDDNYNLLQQARVADASTDLMPPPEALDPTGRGFPPAEFRRMRLITFNRVFLPNLIICIISFVIYSSSIGAWNTVETEYHLIVQEGEKTAQKERHEVIPAPQNQSRPSAR
jgi:hypothetical protein